MSDATFMRRALALAARGLGRTAPNPVVGAVVVAGGQIVGEGWHRRAGEPHAEALALRAAGDTARGATLYVTLEPCCHQGRTPPCTDAVLASGISRVVAAMQDPFPQVAGGGFERLRAASVRVETGLLEAEARHLNRAYLKAVGTGLPWLMLKMATSLDGKVATRGGESRWITGEAARRHVHRLRDRHDAGMIGIGTARTDDPELTARVPGARNPVRVIVDPRGELPVAGRLALTARQTPTIALLGDGAGAAALEALGVQIERAPEREGLLDLGFALRRLVERSIHSVLCEGGPRLAGSLLDAGLIDEVCWFIAPLLIGGEEAPAAVAGGGAARLADALRLTRVSVRRFGPDVAISGCVAHR